MQIQGCCNGYTAIQDVWMGPVVLIELQEWRQQLKFHFAEATLVILED